MLRCGYLSYSGETMGSKVSARTSLFGPVDTTICTWQSGRADACVSHLICRKEAYTYKYTVPLTNSIKW